MADKYNIGAGTFNSDTIWSTTSGGTNDTTHPTSSDNAIFDDHSGNIQVDADAACATLACSSVSGDYTGTITIDSTKTLTVTTSFGMVAAMAGTSGTGTLKLLNNASITSGGKTITWNVTFDGGTWTLGDDWDIDGTITAQTALVQLTGNTIYAGSNLTLTGVNTVGTTNIILNGTGTWFCDSSNRVNNNLTINTSGTITLGATIGYNTGVLTYTSGTIVNTGSLLRIWGNCTLNTSGMQWNDIKIAAACSVTLSSDLNLDGNFLFDYAAATFSGAFDINCATLTFNGNPTHTISGDINCSGTMIVQTGSAVVNGSGKTIYVGGDLTLTGYSISGTAGIVLDTGTSQTWSCSTSALSVGNPLTINATGTVILGTSVGFKTNTLTYTTAGTFTTTDSTLYLLGSCTLAGSPTYNNITITAGKTVNLAAGTTTTLAGTLTANGTTGSHITLKSTVTSTMANLTVPAFTKVAFVDATDIASAAGKHIRDVHGKLDNCTGWSVWDANLMAGGYD